MRLTIINFRNVFAMVIFSIVALLQASEGYCQQPADKNIQLQQLGVNEGISHSDVTAIIQDNSGYLWLGTNNGLNRYDGRRIKIYKSYPTETNGLPESRISRLFKDSRGLIWVGLQTSGVSVFNTESEKFQQLPLAMTPGRKASNRDMRVNDIRESKDGTIWIAGRNAGLLAVRWSKSGKVLPKDIIGHTPFSGKPRPEILCMLILGSNKILLGTDEGLFWYDQLSRRTEKLAYTGNENAVQALLKDRHGRIWIGGSAGLSILPSYLQGELRPQIYNVQTNVPVTSVKAISEDKSGSLWFGTFGSGVFRLDIAPSYTGKGLLNVIQISHKNLKAGFIGSTERINCLFEDKYGLMWVGTSSGGAAYFNPAHRNIGLISNTFHEKKLPDNYITAVYNAGTELWIGTHKGLNIRSAGNSLNLLEGMFVTQIFRDSKNLYWISTRYDGLKMIRQQEGRYQVIDFGQQSHPQLASRQLISVSEDPYGNLWVASTNSGISILSQDLKTAALLSTKSSGGSLSSNKINYVYRDPLYPVMWVSYKDAGIDKITLDSNGIKSITNYSYGKGRTSLSGNYVWPVVRANDSTVWVGTLGGGLNKLVHRGGKEIVRHYTIKNGLYDNDVEAIEIDAKGNLWLAGYGITRFNPQSSKVEAFFDHDDGMQSNAFKVGASFHAKDGRLYFGGVNGLNYFNPDSLGGDQSPPDLIFTDLKIFNVSVPINQEVKGKILLSKALNFTPSLVLSASQHDWTIDFAGLQFARASKIKYYYKLDSYSRGWTETDIPSASFSNLGAGDYKFMVYASTNGIKSIVRSIQLTVLPPWYLTWWAFTLYAGVISGLFYVYRNIITKENELKSELLMAEKEKSLNSAKLDFFTNISHELRTPLSLIYGPLTELLEKHSDGDSRDKLWLMYGNTKKLMTLTNQLLDFRKMESGKLDLKAAEGDLVQFVREIWMIFKEQSAEKNISYHVSTEMEQIPVYFDRQKMELVFSNLLSNAFKYTANGGKINMNIYIKGDVTKEAVYGLINGQEALLDNYVEIVVEDSGLGIAQQEAEKIFDIYYQVSSSTSLKSTGTGLGLSIARGIVKLHKGTIRVESRLGQGSRFITALPFGKRHLPQSSIINDYKGPDNMSHYPEELASQAISPMAELTAPVDFGTEAPTGYNAFSNHQSASPACKLLLVEDNEDLLSYLKTFFSENFKVVTARNGRDGYEKVLSELPDVVISDVMMPEMNGLEMCTKIKADPEVNYIPVILLTARTALVYEIEGIETGADDYITKPFDVRLLNAKVNNLLQARRRVKEYYKKLIAHDSSRPDINAADESFINRMVLLVEANLTNPSFGVLVLSQELAMSKSSLFKRVKDITGSNPVDFIRSVRMRRAATLLAEGSLYVNEIAAEVGMNDLKYFREQFKKHFGCSPTEYTKEKKRMEGMKLW